MAFNPEFLREGSAVADFNMPAKTIVGAADEKTAAAVMSLYEHLPGQKIVTEFETAELVKYVDNAWHALKVAFGNEVGVLAKTLGINSQKVMDIFLEDKKLNILSGLLAAWLRVRGLLPAEGSTRPNLSLSKIRPFPASAKPCP